MDWIKSIATVISFVKDITTKHRNILPSLDLRLLNFIVDVFSLCIIPLIRLRFSLKLMLLLLFLMLILTQAYLSYLLQLGLLISIQILFLHYYMSVFLFLVEEIFSAEVFPLVDFAISLHFLKDEIVAGGLMVVVVGVEVSHHLVSLEAFFLKLLEDGLFVEHVVVAHDETFGFADWLERGLKPGVVTDAFWG